MTDSANDDSEGYIPSVFEYCDRWCERCRFTDRCRVFTEESRRRAAHRAAGRDTTDPEVLMADLGEMLKVAVELLGRRAMEAGMEPEGERAATELESAQVREGPLQHPLNQKARAYAFAAHDLLARWDSQLQAEGDDTSGGPGRADDHDELLECHDVLAHDHLLIATKVFRALTGRMRAAQEENAEPAARAQRDADGSAKVAHLCLVRTMRALTTLHQRRPWLQKETTPLLLMVHDLIEGVDRELPGHKAFKRPGFDD